MSDFGAELARRMLERGVGVRELSRRSGYAAGHITQLRQGRRNPSPQTARDLDDALGAEGALAERVPDRALATRQQRVTGRDQLGATPGAVPGGQKHDHRAGREASAVIAAIGAALHEDRAGRSARSRGQLGRSVTRAWELRQSAQYGRLGELLTGLLRDLASGEAGTEIAVHVYNMTSSLLKRLGAFEMAAVAADRVCAAAGDAGSPLLVGAAKLRIANVYLAAARNAEALAVAAASADCLPPRSGSAPEEVATFGALLLTAAVAAAKTGDGAQAWEFLGQARAATAACDSEQAHLYAVFGPVNLAVHGVQVATELGDGREALRRAERTDPGRMPASLLERRSTLLIDIARAQHMQRDHAGAAGTLIEAERVAPSEVRYSGAALGLLHQLLGQGRPSAGLRNMAARLSAVA